MKNNEIIEKIDMCAECYNKKAEYFFMNFNISFFSSKIEWQFICKECAKELNEKERIEI